MALKEVASQVERKVDIEVPKTIALRNEKFMACISSNEKTAKNVIRKTSRLASYYNAKWFVLYVQTPAESASKIALDKQRHLINNFKLATELGGEVIQVQEKNIPIAMMEQAQKFKITTICIGKPHVTIWKLMLATNILNELLKNLSASDIDLVILS